MVGKNANKIQGHLLLFPAYSENPEIFSTYSIPRRLIKLDVVDDCIYAENSCWPRLLFLWKCDGNRQQKECNLALSICLDFHSDLCIEKSWFVVYLKLFKFLPIRLKLPIWLTPRTSEAPVPTGPWCCMGIRGNGLLDGPPLIILEGDPGDCTNGPRPPWRLKALLLGPVRAFFHWLYVSVSLLYWPANVKFDRLVPSPCSCCSTPVWPYIGAGNRDGFKLESMPRRNRALLLCWRDFNNMVHVFTTFTMASWQSGLMFMLVTQRWRQSTNVVKVSDGNGMALSKASSCKRLCNYKICKIYNKRLISNFTVIKTQ